MTTGYLGDLTKTAAIDALLKVPMDKRDLPWIHSFLENAADASFRMATPQAIRGPDGFPYTCLFMPIAGEPFQCFVLRHMKDDFLLDRGMGVVLEPVEGSVQWVFSYGDILGLHLSGALSWPAPGEKKPESEVLKEDTQVLVGQPSETLLPAKTRKVMREKLAELGFKEPKLFLMERTVDAEPRQELIFNCTPDLTGSEENSQILMRAISWFLPKEYQFGAMDSGQEIARNFVPL